MVEEYDCYQVRSKVKRLWPKAATHLLMKGGIPSINLQIQRYEYNTMYVFESNIYTRVIHVCLVFSFTNIQSDIICRRSLTSESIIAKQLAHTQLWSAPQSKWSQYKVNGLLTGVKTNRDPVTRMWRVHYDSEYLQSEQEAMLIFF